MSNDIHIELDNKFERCPKCWQNFMKDCVDFYGDMWSTFSKEMRREIMDGSLAMFGATRVDWDGSKPRLEFESASRKTFFILKWASK